MLMIFTQLYDFMALASLWYSGLRQEMIMRQDRHSSSKLQPDFPAQESKCQRRAHTEFYKQTATKAEVILLACGIREVFPAQSLRQRG